MRAGLSPGRLVCPAGCAGNHGRHPQRTDPGLRRGVHAPQPADRRALRRAGLRHPLRGLPRPRPRLLETHRPRAAAGGLSAQDGGHAGGAGLGRTAWPADHPPLRSLGAFGDGVHRLGASPRNPRGAKLLRRLPDLCRGLPGLGAQGNGLAARSTPGGDSRCVCLRPLQEGTLCPPERGPQLRHLRRGLPLGGQEAESRRVARRSRWRLAMCSSGG